MFIPSTEENYKIANSYLSVEEANSILKGQKDYPLWDTLSNEDKEALLINASFAVDGTINYKGKKTDIEQILKFPRDTKTTIPLAIKIATAIISLKVAKNTDVKSETIGKLSKTYKDIAKDDDVLAYLNPLKLTQMRINE